MKVEKLVKNFCIKIKVSPQLFFITSIFINSYFQNKSFQPSSIFLYPLTILPKKQKFH